MAITQDDLKQQEVLFTRQNVNHIGERFTSYLLQRKMDVQTAWKQAVEDEAEVIQYKLELMNESVLVWDWPGLQLAAMHREIDRMADMPDEVKAANQ